MLLLRIELLGRVRHYGGHDVVPSGSEINVGVIIAVRLKLLDQILRCLIISTRRVLHNPEPVKSCKKGNFLVSGFDTSASLLLDGELAVQKDVESLLKLANALEIYTLQIDGE